MSDFIESKKGLVECAVKLGLTDADAVILSNIVTSNEPLTVADILTRVKNEDSIKLDRGKIYRSVSKMEGLNILQNVNADKKLNVAYSINPNEDIFEDYLKLRENEMSEFKNTINQAKDYLEVLYKNRKSMDLGKIFNRTIWDVGYNKIKKYLESREGSNIIVADYYNLRSMFHLNVFDSLPNNKIDLNIISKKYKITKSEDSAFKKITRNYVKMIENDNIPFLFYHNKGEDDKNVIFFEDSMRIENEGLSHMRERIAYTTNLDGFVKTCEITIKNLSGF